MEISLIQAILKEDPNTIIFKLDIKEERLFVKSCMVNKYRVNDMQFRFSKSAVVTKQRTVIAHEMEYLIVEYSTLVEGWMNDITKDLIAVSIYSNAFIEGLPDYIEKSICIFGSTFDEYDIYDSFFDERMGMRCKKSKLIFGEIANIIAIRKKCYRVIEMERINDIKIIQHGEKFTDNLIECAEIGSRARKFYNNIFAKKNDQELIMIVLGNGEVGGGYTRGNLIVFGEPPQAVAEQYGNELAEMLTYSSFAHEMGHFWFCKAQVSSFEDWLNETGAEWCMLLLMLEENPSMFQTRIEYHMERLRQNREPIMPTDGHHPNNVHSAGTILFFRLYQRYGADVVKKLLLLLAEMENPCTCDYLNLIRTEYNAEIAEYIEKAIVEKNNETILQY